jgi:hypothetical protein
MKKLVLSLAVGILFFGCSSNKVLKVNTDLGEVEVNPKNEVLVSKTINSKFVFKAKEDAAIKYYREHVDIIQNIIMNDFANFMIKNNKGLSEDKLEKISKDAVKTYNYNFNPSKTKIDTLKTGFAYYVVYKIDKNELKSHIYKTIQEKHKEILDAKVEEFFKN